MKKHNATPENTGNNENNKKPQKHVKSTILDTSSSPSKNQVDSFEDMALFRFGNTPIDPTLLGFTLMEDANGVQKYEMKGYRGEIHHLSKSGGGA